jgi:hypothetical protein
MNIIKNPYHYSTSQTLSSDCQKKMFYSKTIPKSEKQFISIILNICDISVNRLSSYGSPYSNGFNSIMECVKNEYFDNVKSIAKSMSNTKYLKEFHPVIDLPPSPGCEVNWMWFLSEFEDVKLAQVFRSIYIIKNMQVFMLSLFTFY